MAKGGAKRAGRPRQAGKRTAGGRISRAGAVDKGSLGTRLAHARALLGADDRQRLELLVTVSPAKLAAHDMLPLQALDRVMSPDEAAHRERETLFARAAAAENAAQRRDPVGRAWHEGLLSGHGIDAAALRDLGRQYGFLYWHEYRSVDATVGGYTEMVAMGSVRLAGGIGRDGLGALWKAFSAIVDPMGHATREALHKLCVDDMWFAEGPDWLDRCINSARARRGDAVVGEIERGSDAARLTLAVSALVALARGGVRQVQATKIHPFHGEATRSCARCGCPLGNETAESSLYSPGREYEICVPCFDWEEALIEESGTNEHPEIVAEYGRRRPVPIKDVDPRFLDEKGYMKPWADIAAILRGETDDGEEEAA